MHTDAKAYGDCADTLRHGEIWRGRLQIVDVGEDLGRDLVTILGSAPLRCQTYEAMVGYAFGRTAQRTRIVDGCAHKIYVVRKLAKEWAVLPRGNHAGCVSWRDKEDNQTLLLEPEPVDGRRGEADTEE